MQLLFLILILFILAWQDIQSRKVWVLLFPILLGLSIFYKYNTLSIEQIVWNLGFVLFSLLSLTLYLTFKEKRIVAVWKGYFSIGDILFLLAITPLMIFPVYLFYFTIGTFLCIVFHTSILIMKKKATKSIPYAGYMSLILIVSLYFEQKLLQLITHLIS
jgi:hypothetical protein